MLHKSCPVAIKAAGEDDGLAEGQFRALVSVFGNKDSYGDVVIPGAFTDTLAAWAAKGDAIPVYWSHQMSDPDMNIGWVVEAKETSEGLEVLAQVDLDQDASPKAKQAYRLLKGRRVTQFSFAYSVVEGAFVEKDDDRYYELRKLDLHEVGPTPVGANDQTELLGVKHAAEHARVLAAQVKAGRVLSAKNENSLREAVASLEASATQIKNVLASVESEASDQEKASGTAEAKSGASDEEPSGDQPSAKSPASDEEPTPVPSVDHLLAVISIAERN